MHGAIGIRANGDGLSDVPAKDDDGGFGVWAGRLGVRVVGCVEFAVSVFLQRAGTLLFRAAPRGLKLHKLRPCGKLPVDVCGRLHLVAGRVKALCGIWANCKSFLLVPRRHAGRSAFVLILRCLVFQLRRSQKSLLETVDRFICIAT
jgi:hypothetical protein